ncbi:SAP domain-containing ribonucleoprotein [Maniola hyperantus]|uniref:SAP domain-containing ribonucleoprotein n=1 Tax=Aphantopus hyperantus TaxID=2795564 RepID=UPI0015682872|nr:SAP domain-containing ribonucleoprotein [Maniola hyperantus]
MGDSALSDVSKMKVLDIRRELKSRGLPASGDKAALQARLQAAMSQDSHDDHGDINLDSDEIDSDGVLEDEDDKSQNDILDDVAVDTLNEELALEESSPPKQPPETKPLRTLKRKITSETKATENKEAGTKKIVLNRTISVTTSSAKPEEEKKEITPPEPDLNVKTATNKIKITADIDPKTRLEMRAKRFGLPVTMTDEQRKEARKQRFNQRTSSSNSMLNTIDTGSLTGNLDKLKKRAERFGQSVSAIMTDIENKEKIEKRKAKFSNVK